MSAAGRVATPVALLRALLSPGSLEDVLRLVDVDWMPAAITSVEVENVSRFGPGFVMHLCVTGCADDDRHSMALQIGDGDVGEYARNVAGRLRKNGRRQTRSGEIGIVPVPGIPALVRRGGLDERILGLRYLRRPHRLPDVDGLGPRRSLSAHLLAHRLGKRATLRIRGEKRSLVVKAYKQRSDMVRRTARVISTLGSVGGVSVPRVLRADALDQLVVFEDLGDMGGEFDPVDADRARVTGLALRTLHEVEVADVPSHSPGDERAALESAMSLARQVHPDVASPIVSAFETIAGDLARLAAPDRTGVIHRDAHPGQFGGPSGDTIIDFDTAALGDPMQDVGNFVAHLDLSGSSSTIATFVAAYGPSAIAIDRMQLWKRAASLRLAYIELVCGRRPERAMRSIEQVR